MDPSTISRVGVGLACFASTAVCLVAICDKRLRHHLSVQLALTAFWSAAFGWGMMVLAFSWWPHWPINTSSPGSTSTIVSLNVAATIAIGSWAVLMVRILKNLRESDRYITHALSVHRETIADGQEAWVAEHQRLAHEHRSRERRVSGLADRRQSRQLPEEQRDSA